MKDLSKKYTKVYSYIRFSSAIQEQGDSVRRQFDNCLSLCEEYNLKLSELRFEDLGVSGFKGDHLKPEGGLRALLDSVKSDNGTLFPKNKTLLIIDDYSRLGRMEHDIAVDLINSIFRSGISIATASNSQIIDCQTRNSADTIMIVIRMEEAHQESKRKSKYIQASWEGRIEKLANNPKTAKKITSQCPSWLKLDKDTNKFIKIPEKVKIIKEIYKMYSQGMGLVRICKSLNEQGIKPFGKQKNSIWRESTIDLFLSSDHGRVTLGEYQPYKVKEGKRVPYGEPFQNYYPAIIEKKLFYKVQSMRESKSITVGRKGKKYGNIFQGIAKCSKCKSSMVVLDKGEKSSGKVLRCSKAKGNSCTNKTSFHLALFEEAFVYASRYIDYQSLFDAENKDANTERVDDLETEISELEYKVKQMGDVFENTPTQEIATRIQKQESLREEKQKQLRILLSETHQKEEFTPKSIVELIDKLLNRNGSDEEAYLFRSKMNQFLKQKMDVILFCPPAVREGHSSVGGIFPIFSGNKKWIQMNYHHHTSKGVKAITSNMPSQKGYVLIQTERKGREIKTDVKDIVFETEAPTAEDVIKFIDLQDMKLTKAQKNKLLGKKLPKN